MLARHNPEVAKEERNEVRELKVFFSLLIPVFRAFRGNALIRKQSPSKSDLQPTNLLI